MENASLIAGQVVSAGTALAGLILVFLGATLSGFGSYDAEQQNAVRTVYRRRAIVALVGFASSLLAAGFAMAGNWVAPCYLIFIGVGLLAVAFIAACVVACMTAGDLW